MKSENAYFVITITAILYGKGGKLQCEYYSSFLRSFKSSSADLLAEVILSSNFCEALLLFTILCNSLAEGILIPSLFSTVFSG